LAAGLLTCLCLAANGGTTLAQQPTETGVKAGFIFNFVKFTQWSDIREDNGAPLLICALGADPLDGQLALLNGRQVRNRVIEIRQRTSAGEWRNCDALYLADSDAGRVEAVIRGVAGARVLTIGDLPGFVQAGGMIGLRIEEKRMRFDVNLVAAQRAGLKLSSQMLKLAGQVLQ
jgi:hypothetical protein